MKKAKGTSKSEAAKAETKAKTTTKEEAVEKEDVIKDENPEVTDEPQDPEHLHMSLLGESPVLREVYLAVSDDEGAALGDEDLEERVKAIIEEFRNPEEDAPEKSTEERLAELREVSTEYAKQINVAGSIYDGALTKYRIRLGLLFRYQKKLVKETGRDWIEWFAENYDEKHLRSIQDYMGLAELPNIIRYAVFGKERLILIRRRLGKKKGFNGDEDPIGDFLEKHEIRFDPETEDAGPEDDGPIDSWRVDIDAAIAMEKIWKKETKEGISLNPDRELIKQLIGMGTPVNDGMIRDMALLEGHGVDVNDYLQRRYVNGGGDEVPEARTIENDRKLEGIPKAAARLRDTVEYLKDNTDLIEKLTQEQINNLEAQVRELRSMIDED